MPMRKWTPDLSSAPVRALEGLIGLLGEPAFETALLETLHSVMPAASYSVYQTGSGCSPRLYMSASLGVPDTTRECWNAYLSGPYLTDRSLVQEECFGHRPVLCHTTAQEVSAEHRSRVYEAHGMVERVSVVQQDVNSLFAINFYRHDHQAPFSDSHLSGFETLAPALIALAQKQIALTAGTQATDEIHGIEGWTQRLKAINTNLTNRELDVCARLLTGMTQDGIANDLSLSLPTVKTYRNRAFDRLGIHFRNELFALASASHRLA